MKPASSIITVLAARIGIVHCRKCKNARSVHCSRASALSIKAFPICHFSVSPCIQVVVKYFAGSVGWFGVTWILEYPAPAKIHAETVMICSRINTEGFNGSSSAKKMMQTAGSDLYFLVFFSRARWRHHWSARQQKATAARQAPASRARQWDSVVGPLHPFQGPNAPSNGLMPLFQVMPPFQGPDVTPEDRSNAISRP